MVVLHNQLSYAYNRGFSDFHMHSESGDTKDYSSVVGSQLWNVSYPYFLARDVDNNIEGTDGYAFCHGDSCDCCLHVHELLGFMSCHILASRRQMGGGHILIPSVRKPHIDAVSMKESIVNQKTTRGKVDSLVAGCFLFNLKV